MDRIEFLQCLFSWLTKRCTNDKDRHLAVLNFLSRVSIHNPFATPKYDDEIFVTDPIVLLEIGLMQCGQVNRIGHDIFASVGYKTRLVNLKNHTISEIFYNDNWHYFDADTISNGLCILNPDTEEIPSVKEINETALLQNMLDSMNIYTEATVAYNQRGSHSSITSFYCENPQNYGGGVLV